MELGADAEVTVVRTGGVAGVRIQATIAWRDLGPEEQAALERLLADGTPPPARPDRFAYEVVVHDADAEWRCVVGEDGRRAAEAVLQAARG